MTSTSLPVIATTRATSDSAHRCADDCPADGGADAACWAPTGGEAASEAAEIAALSASGASPAALMPTVYPRRRCPWRRFSSGGDGRTDPHCCRGIQACDHDAAAVLRELAEFLHDGAAATWHLAISP